MPLVSGLVLVVVVVAVFVSLTDCTFGTCCCCCCCVTCSVSRLLGILQLIQLLSTKRSALNEQLIISSTERERERDSVGRHNRYIAHIYDSSTVLLALLQSFLGTGRGCTLFKNVVRKRKRNSKPKHNRNHNDNDNEQTHKMLIDKTVKLQN